MARVRSSCEFWFQPPPAWKYAYVAKASRKIQIATRRSARVIGEINCKLRANAISEGPRGARLPCRRLGRGDRDRQPAWQFPDPRRLGLRHRHLELRPHRSLSVHELHGCEPPDNGSVGRSVDQALRPVVRGAALVDTH